MHFPVNALSVRDLEAMVSPEAVPGGNLEAVPTMFYDTQTYPAAGTAALQYFRVTNNDQTLSNMAGAGQFPDPQFFQIYYFTCDVIIPSAAFSAAAPAVWQDVNQIMLAARPTFTFSLSDKPYGTVPLSLLSAAGGIKGFGYSNAAVAATAVEYATNTGGSPWCVDGAIIIPPKTNFSVEVRFGNAAAAVAADTLVRIGMVGNWHRRIL